jgi:general nucleoside transport system permease protein
MLMRDILNPLLAIILTCLLGFIIFTMLGYDGANVVWQLFIAPLISPSQYPDLLNKAAPLILIACGLSLGFKAGIWNIGAEGQYVLGGIGTTGIALLTHEMSGAWILPLMLFASIIGGMAWAALPAFLKNRYQVSEILSSLMLTYVAIQLLYFLLRTSWKDPAGFNFPQTVNFSASQTPTFWFGTSIHTGVFVALAFALLMLFIQTKTTFGFGVKLSGLAPRAARFAGLSDKRYVWAVMLISGGAAGLAGGFEVAGPFGQLVPQFPVNYGFTAIIVAFLGRLNPLGIIFAGLMIATTTIGGELAQTLYKLPSAASSVFQALMLFILLALEHRK